MAVCGSVAEYANFVPMINDSKQFDSGKVERAGQVFAVTKHAGGIVQGRRCGSTRKVQRLDAAVIKHF